MTRVTVTAPPSSGHSGTVDYARLLGAALERQGFETVPPGEHDCAILNFTPYGAGVTLGWLRAVLEARSLTRDGRLLITVFHEVFVRPDDRLRMRMFERAQRWAHRSLVRRSRAVVTSDATRARALAVIAPEAANASVIPIGATLPVPPGPTLRAYAPVIATFGLLHRLRDVETLVRAAPLVAERIPHVQFVIIGDLQTDPERAQTLVDTAASLDVSIVFTGALSAENVAAQLSRARVFVSTYVNSLTFGSTTLAIALGYGLAVVAFEEAELEASLEPGLNLCTTQRDPVALADAIVEAVGPNGDRIAAAGRELYDAYLSWDAIGARFSELLTLP